VRFGKKHLKLDGHLITEDSVLPTTAPGGAPEQNRCYQTPASFIRSPPCARFARALGAPRTAHYTAPPLGAGAACNHSGVEKYNHLFVFFLLMKRARTTLVCRRSANLKVRLRGSKAFVAAEVHFGVDYSLPRLEVYRSMPGPTPHITHVQSWSRYRKHRSAGALGAVGAAYVLPSERDLLALESPSLV
jgi:hypothetical protein